jgi:zinc transporter ZupT
MDFTVILFVVATFVSTLCGGLVIVKFRKWLPYFFAFAAGSLISVAFLDLLPESLALANEISFPIRYLMFTIIIAFFIYSLLEKFFTTHDICHGDECKGHILVPIGAGSLVIHSFLDGVAIGSAYLVNPAMGLIVAFAVIAHDFTDGINTVTVMLRNRQKLKNAVFFLLLDSLAPVFGVLATFVISLPQEALAIILAAFIGEFLYIGASTLLPEVQKNPSRRVILVMALGMIVIAGLTSLI